MSPALPVFQLAANVYMSLLQRFRETLKVELGIFFSLILLRSVDVTETPLPQCSIVLKILEKICNDPPMVADLFINYDCDSDAPNIFKRMVCASQ
jgi:guanine nucleotide-exchange factor